MADTHLAQRNIHPRYVLLPVSLSVTHSLSPGNLSFSFSLVASLLASATESLSASVTGDAAGVRPSNDAVGAAKPLARKHALLFSFIPFLSMIVPFILAVWIGYIVFKYRLSTVERIWTEHPGLEVFNLIRKYVLIEHELVGVRAVSASSEGLTLRGCACSLAVRGYEGVSGAASQACVSQLVARCTPLFHPCV